MDLGIPYSIHLSYEFVAFEELETEPVGFGELASIYLCI
jgi:hypothetical protein